ncbi:MAG: sugar ABC transporter permease [Pseudomonadota bacterium]
MGLDGSFWLGSLLAAVLLWIVASGQTFARIAIIGAGIVAALLLLSIQFDAVFDFGRYRPTNWLVTPNTGWPFFWLVFVFTWSHMGFYMLILLAGLQAIPGDLYEAAKMDATKPFRAFWRITLPLVMPTLTVVIVLALIRSFQIFDEVYLLTGGGPGRETFMIVQNIYEVAFTSNNPDYGQAAAGSVLMAIVIAVFTFVQLWLTRRQSDF